MLTNKKIQSLKPKPKQYKAADSGGLYLLVKPTGSKLWQQKYRYAGKEQTASFGPYPRVELKEARIKREELKKQLLDGLDPRKVSQARKRSSTNTFRSIAEEWLENQSAVLKENTLDKARQHLKSKIYPYIGNKDISDIEPPLVLETLRKIEAKGHHETAHRCKQRMSQVFAYGIATGRCIRNPTSDLARALKPVIKTHRAAITDPKRVGALVRSINSYEGQPTVSAGLYIMARTFLRPWELRFAEWDEIDYDRALLTIPKARAKGREKVEHLVPLSKQVIKKFKELEKHTRHREYVFETLVKGQPFSENTLNQAMKRMGYDGDTMTPHGYRAMASTLLHEKGYPPEVIELQLAHKQRNQVAASYNRSARLPERKKMMQDWANYLDKLAKE
tara:strand:+ start:1489 stop:2661 length:1173 start_codon:yes stop_codon:yes gene_type:complete